MSRSPLVVLTVAIFVEFTCWKLLSPLLPLWASRLGATPLLVGALLTAFSAAELSCTAALGALSDRLGRKPVIVLSLAVSTVSFGMIALADSLALLFAAQIVGGLGTAVVAVGQAAVADSVHPDRLAHAMAYIAGAIGVAYVTGPALAAALSPLGLTVPFWAAAGLAGANTVMTWALLPETRGTPGRAAARPPVRWRDVLRTHWIHRLAAVTLIFGSVIVTLEAVLPLFTRRTLGWAEAPNGWLFAYLGVAVVITQVGVVGRYSARFGERGLLRSGLAVAATGFVVLGVNTALAPVVIGVGLVGAGTGLMIPLIPTLFSLASPAENRGTMLGLAQGLIAVARLIAPLMATAAFTWSIGVPFVIVGSLCLFGAALVTGGGGSITVAQGNEGVR